MNHATDIDNGRTEDRYTAESSLSSVADPSDTKLCRTHLCELHYADAEFYAPGGEKYGPSGEKAVVWCPDCVAESAAGCGKCGSMYEHFAMLSIARFQLWLRDEMPAADYEYLGVDDDMNVPEGEASFRMASGLEVMGQ